MLRVLHFYTWCKRINWVFMVLQFRHGKKWWLADLNLQLLKYMCKSFVNTVFRVSYDFSSPSFPNPTVWCFRQCNVLYLNSNYRNKFPPIFSILMTTGSVFFLLLSFFLKLGFHQGDKLYRPFLPPEINVVGSIKMFWCSSARFIAQHVSFLLFWKDEVCLKQF